VKRICVFIAVLTIVTSLAFSQNKVDVPAQNAIESSTPQSPTIKVHSESNDWAGIFEVYGGYSYLNADINDLGSRKSANGWETAVSGRLYKRLAWESNISGYYIGFGSYDTFVVYGPTAPVGVSADLSARDYVFLGGPRVNLPKGFFVHGLLGMDRLSGKVRVATTSAGDSVSFSEPFGSQNSFAFAPGGGVQIKATHYLSIRATADYFMTHHDVVDALEGLSTQSIHQNHVRFSIGPVFTFGNPRERAITSLQPTHSGMLIPALGLSVTARETGGVEILDVAPGGVASFSGLRVGDVINKLDGKPVNTPMEMAVAMSDRSPGTKVVLGTLIRSQWQAETTVILANHP
jgi:opacity protein-like surface antigen